MCFNEKQNTILWKYFADGEKNGKQKRPEGVHMVLGKELELQDYLTPQQIKSLFSRWTRDYYCKMWKYFGLNKFLHFLSIQYLHVTERKHFQIKKVLQN